MCVVGGTQWARLLAYANSDPKSAAVSSPSSAMGSMKSKLASSGSPMRRTNTAVLPALLAAAAESGGADDALSPPRSF